ARHEDLAIGLAGEDTLAVREVAVAEVGVDADLVLVLDEITTLLLADTEAPAGVVVRRAVRDRVGTVGEAVQMGFELLASHRGAHRSAVADDVEVAAPEVDDALSAAVLDPRVADVPLLRHRPVQHLCTAGHLMDL